MRETKTMAENEHTNECWIRFMLWIHFYFLWESERGCACVVRVSIWVVGQWSILQYYSWLLKKKYRLGWNQNNEFIKQVVSLVFFKRFFTYWSFFKFLRDKNHKNSCQINQIITTKKEIWNERIFHCRMVWIYSLFATYVTTISAHKICSFICIM